MNDILIKTQKLLYNILRRPKIYSREIIQIVIDDGNISSYFTVINYPSFLMPSLAAKRRAFITLRNASGQVIATKIVKLQKYGTRSIAVKDLFPNVQYDIGTISIKLLLDTNVQSELLQTSMHFYVLYKDAKGSIGLVHPQSRLYDNDVSDPFISTTIVNSQTVKKMILYQLNPSGYAFENKIGIANVVDEAPTSLRNNIFQPLEVIKNEFCMKDLGSCDFKIYLNPTQCNSKPLMFLYFHDGTFTMTHV